MKSFFSLLGFEAMSLRFLWIFPVAISWPQWQMRQTHDSTALLFGAPVLLCCLPWGYGAVYFQDGPFRWRPGNVNGQNPRSLEFPFSIGLSRRLLYATKTTLFNLFLLLPLLPFVLAWPTGAALIGAVLFPAATFYQALMLGTLRIRWLQRTATIVAFLSPIAGPFLLLLFLLPGHHIPSKATMENAINNPAHLPFLLAVGCALLILCVIAQRFSLRHFVAQEVA